MKTLGIVANCGKPRSAEVLRRLGDAARRSGIELLPESETCKLMGVPSPGRWSDALKRADALMALGGDGTMLRAVRELDGREIPLIGVNLGSLGFLTSVTEDLLERALECLAKGEYSTSERSLIECAAVREGKAVGHHKVLNDIVVTSSRPRVVTLRMSVNGEEVGDFVCDGLIVSTPTGSTGHSLSAGGPVLLPEAKVFVVSLICPHTLSTRPLVLPDSAVIEIGVVGRSHGATLSADGQVTHPLATGDTLRIGKSPRGVRFIHLPGYSHFAVLRQKLHWRGSNV